MEQDIIIKIIELLGTFAFAISGIRHAAAKQYDWFGGYVCGIAVAIGGGTIRDVMLGTTPFWMTEPPSERVHSYFAALAARSHWNVRDVSLEECRTIFVGASGVGGSFWTGSSPPQETIKAKTANKERTILLLIMIIYRFQEPPK